MKTGLWLVACAFLASCDSCEGPPATPRDAGPDTTVDAHLPADDAWLARPPTPRPPGAFQGRICRNDLYTADLAPAFPVERAYIEFLGRVRGRLSAFGQQHRDRLFGAGACQPSMQVQVRRVDVFDGIAGAEPGRHSLFTFHCGRTKVPLAVRSEAQCDVVAQLQATMRAEAATLVPGVLAEQDEILERFSVARDCEATAAAPPADWHLDPRVLGALPPIGVRPVTLAIVDTAPGTQGPSHGDRVEHIARSVLGSPANGITVLRRVGLVDAPDRAPGTPTTALARTLSRLAMEQAAGGHALVVNLSLGWPPEHGQYITLAGSVMNGVPGACEVTEGPAGESVRTALIRLNRRDGQTLVFSALGNREALMTGYQLHGAPACPSQSFNGIPGRARNERAFFPAAWSPGQVSTCVNGAGPEQALGVAVGIDAWTGVLSGPHIHRQATLLAPGVRLIDPAGKPGTGTSFATAVASALAARILSQGEAGPGPVLARFIQRHTCREDNELPNEPPVRRLRFDGQGQPCGSRPEDNLPETLPAADCNGKPGCPQAGLATAPVTGPLPDLTTPDVFHLAGLTPQPPDPPCPSGDCKVTLVGTSPYTHFNFEAKIHSSYHPDPTPPFITNGSVKLKMVSGTITGTWTLTVSGGWDGGNVYQFNGLALPSGTSWTYSLLHAADWRFMSRVDDGPTEVDRSDPITGP